MQLNATKLANATAITVFILYVVCTLFVVVASDAAMAIAAGIMHIPTLGDSLGEVSVTLGGFILGLVTLVVFFYVSAYVLASLYNRAVRSSA